MSRLPCRLAALSVLLVVPVVRAAPPPEGQDDEKTLKAAGLATDGPALLKFFRDRTPSTEKRDRLSALVRQLGSRSFAARKKASQELAAAGELALPFLKQALKDPDIEVIRRAEACIEEIERVPRAVLNGSAVRLLGLRRPDGAAEVLLAYLPFADWDEIGADALRTLRRVGLKGAADKAAPVAALLAAATNKETRCRAAAASVLGHAGPAHRKPLARLLADPDALVRYHAAAALFHCRDPMAVPALAALLEQAPLPLAWQAEDLLALLADDQPPGTPPATNDPALRKKWRADWEAWWAKNRGKVDLAKVKLDGGALGLTVTCEIDGVGNVPGRISEFDRAGNLRHAIEGISTPADFQRLPGGRILVAEHWAQRVTERDRAGKVLWEHKLGNPVSCQRLANGNTFIAGYHEVIEVTRAGKVVFSHKPSTGNIYCGHKLPGGNVLYITSTGHVVELNAAGKQVRSFTPNDSGGAAYWASIEPLRNGRYLIALGGSGKVIETDGTGKILWECTVEKACWATRLRNGNTLVANTDGRQVIEVDKKGKEVWKKATKGRPFRARRY